MTFDSDMSAIDTVLKNSFQYFAAAFSILALLIGYEIYGILSAWHKFFVEVARERELENDRLEPPEEEK